MASATPREQLNKSAQSAKETARSSLTEQKDGAASSLGEFAGALRKASQDSGDGSAAHMADWAASGLERVSATLRSNDLNGMMREVESFARSQPVAFFFAAAAAGFLATRFLKAGAQPGRDGGGAIEKTDVSSTVPL